MKNLVIVGTGGFGREVAWLVERINELSPKWDILGFVDDNREVHGTEINGYKVLGDCQWLNEQEEDIYAVCAVGAAKTRRKIIGKLNNRKYATLVDPSVQMSKLIDVGEGCIICAGTILTVNIVIEPHVIINLDCTIGHDAYISKYTTLYPSVNVSGNTRLEECVEMGTGSQIIQGIEIEKETIVGAGATVIKDLPKCCVAVGSPAKPIKFMN